MHVEEWFPFNVVILAYSKHFWFCSQFEDFNPDSMDDRMIITNRKSRVQIESLIDFQIFLDSMEARVLNQQRWQAKAKHKY